MADNLKYIDNKDFSPDALALEGDKMKNMATFHRKGYERKCYEANFFDDGYHFRYVSRTTGKILDLNDAGSVSMPQRAIPKASRQIRGIANLLLAPKYVPVVYPEKVEQNDSQDPKQFILSKEQAKNVAQKSGTFLEEEWSKQYIKSKLVQMIILSAKHSVSYLKIWPNAEEEKIETTVRDFFDVYLMGNLTDVEDSPFVIESAPARVADIQVDNRFNEEQRIKVIADNKYASSEVKQAYLQTRFGTGQFADQAESTLLNEAFVKVRLSQRNVEDIMQKTKDPDILAGKRMGNIVMHHFFWAGGVWLLDEYLDMQEYPFVSFQFEPGPLYSRALIDLFIPANKSLDIIVSRLEKWANTMVTGIYAVRKGENFEISNIPGGQKIEYTTTPPMQMQMANVPNAVFDLIGFFNQTIEEQGAATSALGQLPTGVKSGVAIESVKATEYANLEIAAEQLKTTIEKISRKMLYIADNYFVSPKSVTTMRSGQSNSFDVMGKRSVDILQSMGRELPQGIVPISGNAQVRVEIESGLGFTMEGKKQTMQQIIDFMTKLALAPTPLITVDALKVVIQRFMEIYQFGSTQEFMEAMETQDNTAQLQEEQLMQMKVAMIEAMKDAQVVGPQADQKLVDSTKLGVVEAMKDTGMLQKPQAQANKGPSESISFKDLPTEGKVQLAAQAGIQLSPEQVQQQQDQAQQMASDNAKSKLAQQ